MFFAAASPGCARSQVVGSRQVAGAGDPGRQRGPHGFLSGDLSTQRRSQRGFPSVPFQNNTTFGIDRPELFDVSNGGLEDVVNFDSERLEEIRQSIDPARRRRVRDELLGLREDLRNYENETLNVLTIQPVIPFRLGKDLTLVTRTIVPVVSKPTLRRGPIWGLGDISPTFFFVSRSRGAWTQGAGNGEVVRRTRGGGRLHPRSLGGGGAREPGLVVCGRQAAR